MKKALIVLLVVFTKGLLAQEAAPTQNRVQEQPTASQNDLRATPAPKPGHPLGPADVAVLTGKTNRPAPSSARVEVLPFSYAGYNIYSPYVPRLDASPFAGVTTETKPPFVPLLFGRAGNRSIFLIGNTTTFAPPLFFFTSRNRVRSSLFFAPGRTRFSPRWR